jgi:hypothetical protein
VSTQVTLRIIVLRPVTGVTLAVQDRHAALLPPAGRGLRSVWFDVDVRLKPSATPPDFLGEFVHGPPGGRFVYVNAGTLAGQKESCWDRRAKIPLGAIPATLVKQAAADPDLLIAAAIEGAGRDGGPSCATVALASPWRIVRRTRHGAGKRKA